MGLWISDATRKFRLDECAGSRRDFIVGCSNALAASTACGVTDRSHFLSLLVFALDVGLLKSLVLLPLSRFGLPACLTLLTGPPLLYLVLFRMSGKLKGRSLEL